MADNSSSNSPSNSSSNSSSNTRKSGYLEIIKDYMKHHHNSKINDVTANESRKNPLNKKDKKISIFFT